MRARIASAIGPLLGLLVFVTAVVIVHRELAGYRLGDVMAQLHAIPPRRMALATIATALSYVVLTGYDLLALRWIGSRIGYPRIAVASFVAYAFSNNVGLSFLGGSAVRFRMFTAWGVGAGELARAIAFNAITFWLGYLVVAGTALFLWPLSVPGATHPWLAATRPLGVLLLAVAAVYVTVASGRARTVSVRGFTFQLPGARFTAAQLLVSSVDWIVAAAAVWVLLPPADGLGFGRVLGAVLLSQCLGLISNVPGGVGVFETAMVVLLRPWLPGDQVLGALIGYRLVYYVAPLVLAVPLLLAHELLLRSATLRRGWRVLAKVAPAIVPRALALTTFAGGIVLLASGATPAVSGRLELLERLLPLPVLEVSHVLGSIVGVALLLLARAIQQRVDAAYPLTLALLAAGAVVSLLKGLDWEEATLLAVMFLALAPCRRYFDRRSSLASQSFTPGWIASVVGVLIATGLLTLLAHRDVEYSHTLWWSFDVEGHASRSLRALAGAVVLLGAWGGARLLRPVAPLAPAPGRRRARPGGDNRARLAPGERSPGAARRQAASGARERSWLRHVRRQAAELGVHGRPGGAARDPGRAGVAVSGARGSSRRARGVLRGGRGGPANLSRPGPVGLQARGGGARSADAILARRWGPQGAPIRAQPDGA